MNKKNKKNDISKRYDFDNQTGEYIEK